jgi:hypothetical protein
MANPLTEDEFRRWWTPAQVLEMLPKDLSGPERRDAVAKPIKDGLVLTAAGAMVLPDREPRRFVPIRKGVWEHWGYRAGSPDAEAFWKLGRYEVYERDAEGYAGELLGRLYDVRLDPEGVRQFILPPAAAPVSPASAPPDQATPTKTTRGELREWFGDYAAATCAT